jgi:hypothetical protein
MQSNLRRAILTDLVEGALLSEVVASHCLGSSASTFDLEVINGGLRERLIVLF